MPNAISVVHKGAETKGGCLAVVSDIEFIFFPFSLSLFPSLARLRLGGNHGASMPRNIQVDVYSFNSTSKVESALEHSGLLENCCGKIFRLCCSSLVVYFDISMLHLTSLGLLTAVTKGVLFRRKRNHKFLQQDDSVVI